MSEVKKNIKRLKVQCIPQKYSTAFFLNIVFKSAVSLSYKIIKRTQGHLLWTTSVPQLEWRMMQLPSLPTHVRICHNNGLKGASIAPLFLWATVDPYTVALMS